jgi:hypothetical protein
MNLDGLMRIGEVPAYILKTTGVSQTRQTVYNWAATKGVRVARQTFQLQTETHAGQMFTREEWVDEFLARLDRR